MRMIHSDLHSLKEISGQNDSLHPQLAYDLTRETRELFEYTSSMVVPNTTVLQWR